MLCDRMQPMNISVIIPVLNEEKTIAATLLRLSATGSRTKSSLSTAAVTIAAARFAAEFNVRA